MNHDETRCPLCGGDNRCGQLIPSTNGEGCWCLRASIPAALLALVPPELTGKACICRSCVETALQKEQQE
ncbi:hypothetical protein PaecuDRAFT_2869 [Paenibacillus curdlanolyticus YK9]|uniref:Cysteine-rich CWC n=1 Tax=Paenibacillus curdlanolyticus YK9 TaxID=717606 RepID=E0IAM9_9BACL|nr:cysteine-rich CWC family protein [Paenibacillus curdlanolyticus]EFM10433.1 hypothetical protein PaecuDRAFT_2869 [Paenibacillus curdlanolyticus YK9]